MAQEKKTGIAKYKIPLIIFGGIVAIAALAAVLFGLIIPGMDTNSTQGSTNPSLIDSSNDELNVESTSDEDTGLQVDLSPGGSQPQETGPLPLETGEPLTPVEVEQVLARLPDLTVETSDQVDFNLPEEPLPPPRTGETIEEPFPPPPVPVSLDPVAVGPLEVLRFSPEGEIPLAPFVNVTFNQPMVPIGTLSDLANEEVPVQLEPALPGTWRWLGTKTLNFQFDSSEIDRLPMATEYVVTIPAGTESATGGLLADSVSWAFSTPPPEIISKHPYDVPQPLDPLFFIAFDQRIDPEAVLETTQVTAGSQPVRLKLVTDEAVETDKIVKRLAENAGQGRWLVFRAQEPLPPDTPVSVEVGPGTPSAEGPLVTQGSQHFSFHTYAPLRIDDHGCSWSDEVCRPLTPFFIEFNNPLDVDAYEDSMLSINPELPGASVNIFGDTIQIQGASQGQTTYQVTVSAADSRMSSASSLVRILT